MISKKLVDELNKIVAEFSGGASGIRDEKSLLAAINRPFQTFDSKDLYPSAIDKAAAIFQSIIINHPFIDGNKRMAYALMMILLLEDGLDIEIAEEEKYNFVIKSAKGETDFEEIKSWIIDNLKK